MKLECKLYIDGKFEGVINSQKEVTIGKNGKVIGEIFAKKVIVQGELHGSVSVDTIIIKPEGKVFATVESNEFIIEQKGVFEGKSIIKKETQEEQKVDISKS